MKRRFCSSELRVEVGGLGGVGAVEVGGGEEGFDAGDFGFGFEDAGFHGFEFFGFFPGEFAGAARGYARPTNLRARRASCRSRAWGSGGSTESRPTNSIARP